MEDSTEDIFDEDFYFDYSRKGDERRLQEHRYGKVHHQGHHGQGVGHHERGGHHRRGSPLHQAGMIILSYVIYYGIQFFFHWNHLKALKSYEEFESVY